MTQRSQQSYCIAGTSFPTFSNHKLQFSKLQDLIEEINQESPIDTNVSKNQLEEVCQRARRHAKCDDKLGVLVMDDRIIQGILYVFSVNETQVMLMVSTLAAGFLIGENGSSVNTCSSIYSVSITSWSSQVSIAAAEQNLGVRIFAISGHQYNIELAIQLFVNVVNRYRELTEGKYQDEVVDKIQCINGINFEYKPPPIHIMPLSARTIEFLDMKPSMYGKMKQEKQKRLREQNSQTSTEKQSLSTQSPTKTGFEKVNSYALPLYSPQKTSNYSSSTTPSVYAPYNYGYMLIPLPLQPCIPPTTSPQLFGQPIYHPYSCQYPIISGNGEYVPFQAQGINALLPNQM
eukprot:TRINITY_DN1640_c0_g1_i7.p1 TRINITY_DN1640_c0_g1~~TRINITY_DN1640_c0_g1_i7.p1  ORF type:complete len:364 (-),score=8.91 TRINITY_DN1640_c0_g1_i7:1733-2770(-)